MITVILFAVGALGGLINVAIRKRLDPLSCPEQFVFIFFVMVALMLTPCALFGA
jgi:hypothetical protein